ncbi:MAG: hypothetical protein IPJ81_05715 [Chitinophagaceae bacterium]|nr:hypothetical protein [Chitinophagaceae bacterium]
MSLLVRWQKMALLVLRRVGLCVGQNQMCHLCGWLKIELKKCAVGKIKNTEGSAMSIGSVAVQLKYGLYVGHLSKLAFHFMFIVVRLVVVVSSVRLACNVWALGEEGDFTHQISKYLVVSKLAQIFY